MFVIGMHIWLYILVVILTRIFLPIITSLTNDWTKFQAGMVWFQHLWSSLLGGSENKSWLIGKDPDAGRDWGQEKETTEDEMAGWHHQLDGHEFEWTLGVGDGQGGLECRDSWGRKESDTTEWLNWTENRYCQRARWNCGTVMGLPGCWFCQHRSIKSKL